MNSLISLNSIISIVAYESHNDAIELISRNFDVTKKLANHWYKRCINILNHKYESSEILL